MDKNIDFYKKKIYAFIFARGGSKGLPNKNILKLGNKPLLAHSIDVAKQIKQIERIFVSTDNQSIKSIALKYGAEVIIRPANLSGDFSPEVEAWRHAITYLKDREENFDIFVSLPTTSPLRNCNDVINAIEFLDDRTDAVITVTPSSRSPYFNIISRKENGLSKLLFDKKLFFHRQSVPRTFDITTVAYVLKPNFILQSDNIFDGNVKSLIIPKERAVDIDDYNDFLLAKFLWEKQNHND